MPIDDFTTALTLTYKRTKEPVEEQKEINDSYIAKTHQLIPQQHQYLKELQTHSNMLRYAFDKNQESYLAKQQHVIADWYNTYRKSA